MENKPQQEDRTQDQGGFAPVSGQTSIPKKKSNKTFLGILIIVILIILISVLPDGSKEEIGTGVENENEQSSLVEENGEVSVLPASGVAKMQPITYDGHTYKFDDIDWLFASDGEDTAGREQVLVRIQFVNFTKDGIEIDVLPYRLGVHQGSCAEVGLPLDSETAVSGAKPLAFVNCTSSDGIRQMGVYQDGRLIETYLRFQVSRATSMTEMVKIQTIDMAKIVQD